MHCPLGIFILLVATCFKSSRNIYQLASACIWLIESCAFPVTLLYWAHPFPASRIHILDFLDRWFPTLLSFFNFFPQNGYICIIWDRPIPSALSRLCFPPPPHCPCGLVNISDLGKRGRANCELETLTHTHLYIYLYFLMEEFSALWNVLYEIPFKSKTFIRKMKLLHDWIALCF